MVTVELPAISTIRTRYTGTPFGCAAGRSVLGGGLVLATGVLIGSA